MNFQKLLLIHTKYIIIIIFKLWPWVSYLWNAIDTIDFFFYPLTFVNWNLTISISLLDNSKLLMQSPPSSVAFQSSLKLVKAWNDFLMYLTDIWIQKRNRHSCVIHVFMLWFHSDIASCDNSNGANKTYVFLAFTKSPVKKWGAKKLAKNYLQKVISLDFNLKFYFVKMT